MREDREAEQERGEPERLQLLVHRDAHPLEEPRDDDEARDADHGHEGPQVKQRRAGLGGVSGARAPQDDHRLEEREHHDRHDVLEDGHAERELARALVVQARLVEDLPYDRGGRDHEHPREEEALGGVPAERRREQARQVVHRDRAPESRREYREPQAPQLAQAQAQADREHEEDEPDLGERLDPSHVRHEREIGHPGADKDAGGEEADDDRKSDPLAEPAHGARDDEDYRQVLNEQDSVHGLAFPKISPPRASRQP